MLSPFHGLQLVLGLSVWLLWFGIIYGLLSVVCAVAPPAAEQGPLNWINGVLLLLTFATVALLLYWARRCWRAARAEEATRVKGNEPPPEEEFPSRRLVAYVAAGGHCVAAVSTLWVGLVVIYLPACL